MVKRFLVAMVFAVYGSSPGLAADSLEQAFHAPDHSAKPRAYWFHMRGNITKPGITADLEAMKEIGLGGTLFMNVSVGVPMGLVETKEFMSPAWQECFQHMLAESARLGLDFGSALCDGWGNAGGPAIPPDLAMQHLTWSETRVAEGQTVEIAKLPQPETLLDYYRDVAVLAMPLSAADIAPAPPARQQVRLVRSASGPAELRFDFPAATSVGELTLSDIRGANPFGEPVATLEASDDGQAWRVVQKFPVSWRGQPRTDLTVAFDPVTARHFRLVYPEAGYFRGGQVTLGGAALSNRPRIHYWQAKAAIIGHNEHGGGAARYLDAGAGDAPGIAPESVVNLTGQQTWRAPAGHWLVLRIGHTPTGAHNAPATEAGVGLECDKFNPRGVQAQHEAFIDKLLAAAKPAAKQAYKHTWIDSWEVGPQNWTARFAEEFRTRRGYDLTPWLPVLCGGRIVGTRDRSERFLWDFRRTIADLLVDNYWKRSKQLAEQRGLEFRAEAFGRQQFMYDVMNYARANHMPCGEFWVGGGPRVDCKAAASAAHLSGRQIAGAEAFTAGRGNWLDDPWSLKALGDRAFCLGVNQYYVHRYAHQPWLHLAPGMPFGPYGINFERTNTWWQPGRAWVAYLTRCQALLQHGRFVADVLVMLDEGAPTYGGWRHELAIPLPAGFDYDFANLDALRESRVDRGEIVHQNGMRYRLLMLPGTGRATPALLREVLRLAEAGAAVAAPRAITRAHGMADDAAAAALWQSIVATGRAIVAEDFAAVQERFQLRFDFQHDADVELLWIHRTDGAGADWYFVSNQSDTAGDVCCTFRVTGRQPELWDAATGTLRDVARFAVHGQQTTVQIPFEPRGAWFVVFRKPASPLAVTPRPSPPREPDLPAESPRVVDNFTLAFRARPAVEIAFPTAADKGWMPVRGQNHAVLAKQGELMFGAGHANLGVSVGRNGVLVWEHSARYRPARIVIARPILDWTHIAVVCRDRQPTVYLNGQEAGTAARSPCQVHPGCGGVFQGERTAVQLIDKALSADEVAGLAAHHTSAQLRRNLWIVDGRLIEEVEQPNPMRMDEDWEAAFPPGRGAPPRVPLGQLLDLSKHADDGIKHFSGTVSYRKTIRQPAVQTPASETRFWLDLGTVANLAEVLVNGRSLGVLWKRPFRVDVTDALRDGDNQLEIRVTNLWVNRLIGDASKMAALGVTYGERNGAIARWPAWVPQDAPPPDAPVSFAGWQQWQADDPLQPAGLIGPVTLGQSRRGAPR